MGKPTRPQAEYRDDPDAVSLHTTPDDYGYDDAPEISGLPPSYADSEVDSNAASTRLIAHVTPHPTVRTMMDHDGVVMSGNKPQAIETLKIMELQYDADPEQLEQGVKAYAQHPPNPLVYIMGTHRETVKRGDKKETKRVTDFRIVLNMRQYLCKNVYADGHDGVMRFSTAANGDKTYRGGFMKQRAPGYKQDIEVGSAAPTLREWCHRYCASPAKLRIFRIRREVLGFDETFLKNRIEGLIRSTNYRGHLSINFPIVDKNVDFYTSNKINEWRLKTWVRWVFYLSFLWIFSWPSLFFATKRWSVVKAEWMFSFINDHGSKQYATISEEEWFDKWQAGIRRMVLDRFQGEASYEQLQGVMARPNDPPVPGTISTGHAGVDSAMGILTQGIQVASAISRGDNLSRGLQGGWGYDT